MNYKSLLKILLMNITLVVLQSCDFISTIKLEPLPEKFNAYQSFEKGTVKSASLTMSKLFESNIKDYDLEHFMTLKNHVIFKVPTEKTVNFYDVNQDGNIVDSLKLPFEYHQSEIKLLNHLIINKDAKIYYTWGIDGDKTPKDMILQNEDLSWDEITQRKHFNEILDHSEYYNFDYVILPIESQVSDNTSGPPIIEGPKLQHFINYIKNQQYFRFYYTIKNDREKKFLMTDNDLFKKLGTRNAELEPIPARNIKHQFFHRTSEKIYEKINRIGGGSPATKTMLWQGNLYSNIAYQKDTLKVYQDLYLEDVPKTTLPIEMGQRHAESFYNKNFKFQEPYQFFSDPKLNFALFTNDSKKVYIIKPIQK